MNLKSLGASLASYRCGARLFLGAFFLLAVSAASAALPTTPFLRIDTEMHTSLIRRIIVDPAGERLITAGDDKTIRLWRATDGRWLQTLRVPIGTGHEGQLFGIAIAPDGRTLAAAGWTGWDGERTGAIYFIDIESGDIIRRVGGLPETVSALAWSADGRHVLAGLQSTGGFFAIDTRDGAASRIDTEYADKILEIDVARDGRVVVVSLDGSVRLYDRTLKLAARRAIIRGARPIALRLSPDATEIAVSFIDRPMVAILSTATLATAHSIELSPAEHFTGLSAVAWSIDGLFLYAAGDYRGPGGSPIVRWSAKGRGTRTSIAAARGRIAELRAVAPSGVAYASEDPSIGIVDDRRFTRESEILAFDGARGKLAVSADGGTVRYPITAAAERFRTYRVADWRGPTDRESAAPLSPPITAAAGWTIENWQDRTDLRINGRRPKLDDHEISRSYAIAPNSESMILGTEWALRRVDRSATTLWHVRLAAVVRAVNVSGDGRLVVAALADGTIRWYRLTDGEPVLAFFPHANNADWIAWVPSGYYASSSNGDNFVGWHVNRGAEQTPDFYHAGQFERLLYRPDIVAASLATRSRSDGAASATPINARDAFDVSRLRDIAPPRLRVRVTSVETPAGAAPRARLRIEGERVAASMRDLTVYVNGIPAQRADERRLAATEAERVVRELDVPLEAHDNRIRVESLAGVSMGVAEARVELSAATRIESPAGDLYLLAIGNNTFPALGAERSLAYAARDATELARTLGARAQRHFKRVHTRVLADDAAETASGDNVRRAMAFINGARGIDTVVVFLASHGLSDREGNYYFVPRDAVPADVTAVGQGGRADSLVPWTAFFEALRDAAGRRILVVDTCHARNIGGTFEPYSLAKRSVASHFAFMVAAAGDEESQEYDPARHGLFTYALLDAFSGGADKNGDGLLSLREAFDHARPIVERLRDPSLPQTPQLIAPKILEDAVLARVSR